MPPDAAWDAFVGSVTPSSQVVAMVPLGLPWLVAAALVTACSLLELRRRRDRVVDPRDGRTVEVADHMFGALLPWLAPGIFLLVVLVKLAVNL